MLKRQHFKATEYEEEFVRWSVRVSFLGSLEEKFDVSLILLTILTKEHGHMSLCLVCGCNTRRRSATQKMMIYTTGKVRLPKSLAE